MHTHLLPQVNLFLLHKRNSTWRVNGASGKATKLRHWRILHFFHPFTKTDASNPQHIASIFQYFINQCPVKGASRVRLKQPGQRSTRPSHTVLILMKAKVDTVQLVYKLQRK